MAVRHPESPEQIFSREEEPIEPRLAPRPTFAPHITVADWLRKNLFSGLWNTLGTLLCAWVLWKVAPPLVDWVLLKAVWRASGPEQCRAAEGACWALIEFKHRFILFGLYPWDEQWRPLLAVLLFMVALFVSCHPRFWRRWLLAVWAATFAACAILMWGGAFGLTYVSNTQWGGLPLTLILSVVGIVCSFPLAILLALGRRSDMPGIRSVCVGFIEFVRGVPLVSVLFMASVMFPLFLPEGVTIDKLLRAQIGIVLFTAAYLAEAVRGGLQAVPLGQYEAADALGLGYWRKMGLVILPQALKVSIPPLVNQFISMFKDTSLVIIIGLFDLLTTAKTAVSDPQWRPFFVESYLFVALIYWGFCFFTSRYSLFIERRLDTGHRRT